MEIEWSIPQPPEDLDAVQDPADNVYHRSENEGMRDYWFNEDVPGVRGTYEWSELLYQRGPVRAL